MSCIFLSSVIPKMLRLLLFAFALCWMIIFSATTTLANEDGDATQEENGGLGGEDIPMVVTFVNEMPNEVSFSAINMT